MLRTVIFLLKEILYEAQAIQAKQDNILRKLTNQAESVLPMSYDGQTDPLSQRPVLWKDYTLEDGSGVTVRRSGTAYPPQRTPAQEI